jgi:hypothetical protein
MQAEAGQGVMLGAILAAEPGSGWGGTAAVVASHHEDHVCYPETARLSSRLTCSE